MQAQLCTNPTDTVYGLNSITASGFAGQIAGVNINDGTSNNIGLPAAGGENANGLGFSQITGKFYFFNRCGSGTIEFVSYDPLTGSKVVLAAPPATILTSHKIRSGACNNAGDGYYTINPNAAVPYFYYYNIPLDTWTTVTSTFLNTSGTTVTDFKTLNSGDMAFDGSGNLWVLCSGSSSGSKYSLYKISAPVPTTAVASITVDTIVGITATPSGVNFTGVAFNSSGKLYLTTGSGGGAGNNQLYEMASTGVLTLKGTVSNGYGDDLSSCIYPVGVLPIVWVNFSAAYHNNSVNLSWKINEDDNVTGYNVETSRDGEHWQLIDFVQKDNQGPGSLKTYYYGYTGYSPGISYYRIVEVAVSGNKSISAIRTVNTSNSTKMYIGPNPVKDIIHFYNNSNSLKLLAQIFNNMGNLVYSTTVEQNQQSINVGQLPRGSYILKLFSTTINESPGSYHFIKW